MPVFLGIDIGTSSTKAMLFDTEMGSVGVVAKDYGVEIPCSNYAEQDADIWWNSLVEILQELKDKHAAEYAQIAGIGFSGQMHGLVTVDQNGKPLRPAIIWLDQRSNKQLKEIEEKIGLDRIGRTMHNRVFTGFAFPSLLWIQEEEPELFEKIYKVMLPKDYIRFRMTGQIGTEASDGSSTTGFNVKERDWAWDVIDAFGMPREIFAECHEAMEIAGEITKECAEMTGLRAGIPVVYGAGDQPAYSVGIGAIGEGCMSSNIGTGGQMAVYSKEDRYDPQMRIHTFCHAVNKAYTIFGAHLCSGLSLKWLRTQILSIGDFEVMNQMAAEIDPGSEGVLYLPYLTGCRSPEMDPLAKGMFFGLQLKHDKRHFVRAVMEGIIYDFRRSQDIFEELGIHSNRVIACGGGAKSPIWLQIQADILNREVQVCKVKEQACLGACIMAGVGVGLLDSVESACKEFVQMEDRIYNPNPLTRQAYDDAYTIYKQLYNANKALF